LHTDIIIILAAREEDAFVADINSIIPILNGNAYPEELKKSDLKLPSQPEKSKHYGPRVMIKPRDLILLYVGKRIAAFKADGQEIDGLTYFSASFIDKIANYPGFSHQIDYQRHYAHKRYLNYEKDGLVYKQLSKKPRGGLVFTLSEEGEQYCNTKINDYLIRIGRKRSEIISLQSGFDEIKNELYHSYGLTWLPKDHFESHKSGSSDLDNWRKGFPSFGLPAIKSRRELRRESVIADIKTKLKNQKRVLIIGTSGSSKSTVLMELMCDYFDAGYEIIYNEGMSELKNLDGLVNFIENRLKMNEKILVAIDDAHSDGTNSIFYVLDKLSNSELTKDLRFIVTARLPEFKWLLDRLDKVHEELRKSIRKLSGDINFIYQIPYFTKEDIRDFIKLYSENISPTENGAQVIYDYTRGDPIMVKFAVLGQGIDKDVKEMSDRYLRPQQELKTMLICSLLDISSVMITDSILEQCGVLESAYHLNGSTLYRNTEGIWRTKHPRWDEELFSFLYGNNTRRMLSNRGKQDLMDSLNAIFEMGDETVTYSAIITLYDMALQKFVPIELFHIIFSESVLHNPMILSKEKVSYFYVLISEAYYRFGEFRGALDSSNEAVKWDIRNANAYLRKGIALMYLKLDDEAVECLEKALDINPGLASAWMEKGNALDFSGRHKEALLCYDKAEEIDPHYLSLVISINRGGCFYNMRKYKPAIVCFDKVLNIINSEKLPNLLQLLDLNKRELLLYQIDSWKSRAYRLKGICLIELGKYEGAVRCFDKALEIDPSNTDAWYQKAYALIELKKYEAAINAYQELLNISPDKRLDLWLRKGYLHTLLGNYKEAIDCYDHVLKINSDYAETWFHKGAALIRLGRSDDAQFCFDKAKELGFDINSSKKEEVA
jgi:tetratricopeptide (TPR) repeat protein/energy-coupling factor transporter ATP-binding protein EcfA2